MQLSFVFRKRWLWLYPPLLLLSSVLMWLSVTVWLPLPPQVMVMAGGLPTGTYMGLAVRYRDILEQRGIRVHYPELEFCTDNGAMIALAAGMRLQAGLVNLQTLQRGYTFDVKPRWNLAELQLEPAAVI